MVLKFCKPCSISVTNVHSKLCFANAHSVTSLHKLFKIQYLVRLTPAKFARVDNHCKLYQCQSLYIILIQEEVRSTLQLLVNQLIPDDFQKVSAIQSNLGQAQYFKLDLLKLIWRFIPGKVWLKAYHAYIFNLHSVSRLPRAGCLYTALNILRNWEPLTIDFRFGTIFTAHHQVTRHYHESNLVRLHDIGWIYTYGAAPPIIVINQLDINRAQ